MLGWQFRIATNDIQVSQVGFFGIAVALLGRNTAGGTVIAALLFGALLNGTSVRNLDPAIFAPELATNLTYIIQGLIVLFVSAPVLVTVLTRGRFRRKPQADAQARGLGRRMSAATQTAPAPPGSRIRARLARVSRAAWLGWAGVALGVIAFYLALPPLLVRSIVPSLIVALGGLALGVTAIRGGEKRVGWFAIVACVAGAFGAYGAVKSGVGNLERVVVWSALLAAALRYATPLTFAALGGVISERSGRGEHRARGDDADRRLLRRLGRGHHRHLARRDPDRAGGRRRDRPPARDLRGQPARGPDRLGHGDQLPRGRASPASCS